jgi:hypothetical protein
MDRLNVTYKQLSEIVDKSFKKKEINSILDLDEYWVISIIPKGLSKDDYVLDGLFKVNKRTYMISEFNVNDDRAAYLSALKHPVYVRK